LFQKIDAATHSNAPISAAKKIVGKISINEDQTPTNGLRADARSCDGGVVIAAKSGTHCSARL